MTSLSGMTATPPCRSLLSLYEANGKVPEKTRSLLNAPWGLPGDRYGVPTGFELETTKQVGDGEQFEVIDISKLKKVGE